MNTSAGLVLTPAPILAQAPRRHRRSQMAVQRLSGTIGACVSGIDLANVSNRAQSELVGLIAQHHVVFLRNQHLSEPQFAEFAGQFGQLSVHPLRSILQRPQTVSVIEDTAERPPAGFPWHTDLSWLSSPPRLGFLQAQDIPAYGGDTMWASMTAAHNSLSPSMQLICAELRAIHRIDPSFRATVLRNHGTEVADRLEAAHPEVSHPLVRQHPDTGMPSLYLSPLYLDRIEGFHPDESSMLLDYLNSLIENPSNSVRWRWAEGDVAIWDESTTVHRALTDHYPLQRRMRRCTTEGPLPVAA